MKYNNVLVAIDKVFEPDHFPINAILKDNITLLDPSLIDLILAEGANNTGKLNDLADCGDLDDVLELWEYDNRDSNTDGSETNEEEQQAPKIATNIKKTAAPMKEEPAAPTKATDKKTAALTKAINKKPAEPVIEEPEAPMKVIEEQAAPAIVELVIPQKKILIKIKKPPPAKVPAAKVLLNTFYIGMKISISDGEILLGLYDNGFLAKTIGDTSKIMMIDIESCMDMIYPFILRIHNTSTNENVLRFIADGIKAINKGAYNCVNKVSYIVKTYEDNPRYCYILLE